MLPTGQFYNLGTQESAYFTTDSGHIAICYTAGTGGRYAIISPSLSVTSIYTCDYT